MTPLESALVRLISDLQAFPDGARFALVGGLAISLRSEPRTTQDIDVVVAVVGDSGALGLVRFLVEARGYLIGEALEHEPTGRLMTQRLTAGRQSDNIVIDLLFASSGIEDELVAGASVEEILPGLRIPVAGIGDLLALKVLAGRDQDRADFRKLLARAAFEDVATARHDLDLISRRGFDRGRDLRREFEEMVAERGSRRGSDA